MSFGMVAVAGASLVGGMMGADATEDAANIQAGTTRDASALAERQFNAIRGDLSPYRGLGSAATNALAQGLGLTLPPAEISAADRAAIRERLLPQYTTGASRSTMTGGASAGAAPEWMASHPVYSALAQQHAGMTPVLGHGETASIVEGWQGGGGPVSSVDEAALQAAIEREVSAMQAAQQQGQPGAGMGFGSLMQDFTGKDLENEPGYQFGLDQGMRALDNRLAAAGSYFSGAAIKGGQRFAQDYAGTKFGEAFNRDAANKSRKYNFLTGAVSTGQNAATQTGNAGQNMVNAVGANTTALGNAQGAARIAGGNAIAGGINGAIGAYQQNQLMNAIRGGNAGFGSGGFGGSGFGTGLSYGNQDIGQFL